MERLENLCLISMDASYKANYLIVFSQVRGCEFYPWYSPKQQQQKQQKLFSSTNGELATSESHCFNSNLQQGGEIC